MTEHIVIWWHWHPLVGVWIGILGLLGVLVPLLRDLSKIGKVEKAVWTFVAFLLLLLEVKSVYQDRNEHDQQQFQARAEQLSQFAAIARNLDATIATSREHFDATMNRMGGILSKQEKSLLQTMGGTGYPFFFPETPLPYAAADKPFPVRVWYFNYKNVPLVDVNVDITLRPPKGQTLDEFLKGPIDTEGTGAGDPSHPRHYGLGTILAGDKSFLTPISLQPGHRYYLKITTRRGMFYEWINIDRNPATQGGYDLSLCLFRWSDGKLLQGKCDMNH